MITFMAGKRNIHLLIEQFGDALTGSPFEQVIRGKNGTLVARSACFAPLLSAYQRRFPRSIHLVTPLATDGVIEELTSLFPSFTWARTTWGDFIFTSVSFCDDTPFDLAYNALCLARLYSDEGVETINLDFEIEATPKGYRVVATNDVRAGLPVRRMLVNAVGSWFSRLHLPMDVDEKAFNIWARPNLYRMVVHPETFDSDASEVKAAVAYAIVDRWIERITTTRYPNDPWKTERRLASGLQAGELFDMLVDVANNKEGGQ